MADLLTPPRVRGIEYLDDPAIDPRIVHRSLHDVALSNRLFGGARAVLVELAMIMRDIGSHATLLDVGSGLGDIPLAARHLARELGVTLTTVGIDLAAPLANASRTRTDFALRGTALELPFRDGAVDIVTCSQTLHHFDDDEAALVLRELNRVARARVIVSDLRRSWVAAAGIWLVSFPLRFHPVSRHDGVASVMRGFTAPELLETVQRAVGGTPVVRRRVGFRVTASWVPTSIASAA